MALVVIVLMIVGLGAAVLVGRTADSRDPDYGLGGLVGRSPVAVDDREAAQVAVWAVPAAWLIEPDGEQLASGVESLG
ncbi:MAG: hypothetical protein QOE24_3104 [Frankiales bacterium]|jgi:hypothetical protein|nr:hypothetical protein [Frankiales bacterium]